MSALYVIGNTNLNTVETVISSIVKVKNDFSKIFILNSSAAHEVLDRQMTIYSKYLGDVRYEELLLEHDGSIDQNKLISIFKEHECRFIDLTHGLKTTASILYMVANLCGIENVYYLMKKANDESEYIKIQKFCNAQSLAKFSFFDLIYYNDEIDEIFKDVISQSQDNSFFGKTYDELKIAVTDFFINCNYKNTIASATSGNEVVIKKLLEYLQGNSASSRFAVNYSIDLFDERRDPVGIMTFFYKEYMKNGRDSVIMNLHCVPWLLSTLREFRNGAAHYLRHGHVFTYGEARVVINMSIEMYKILQKNPELWSSLNE